jgi:type I restriction enzyme, S subunit
MPEKLPKGWVKTTLGEISKPSRDRALPRDVPTMRYVGLEHIEPQTMRLLGTGYAHEVRSSSVHFRKADVLYGKMRPYLNKVWVAEFEGICSAEFLVFPKQDGLNSHFLALRLNGEDFVAFANGKVSGERPRVDFNALSRFPILLPPVAEQERIVTKLDAVSTKVRRAEMAAHKAQDRLRDYHAAVLHEAVIGRLTRKWRIGHRPDETGPQLLDRLLKIRRAQWEQGELRRLNEAGRAPKDDKWKTRYRSPTQPTTNGLPRLPNGWAWISIDELAWASGYGTSVKCTREADGPAVLRIPNIRNRSLNFEDLKFATHAQDFRDEDYVAPGDMLLVRTNGSRSLIGRVAIVKTAPNPKSSFASYLIRFRLIGNETIWSWVSLAWDSDTLRSSIESRAKTTAGQYNVSLSGLADLGIPLPPIDEQIEIGRQVDRRISAAERLAATLGRRLDHARVTRQSLLREAFSGHLVPQDSNDEPASALLDRIQIARQAENKMPKGKRMSRSKSKTARRSLLDVLRQHKRPMTPESLFRDSGFEAMFNESEEPQDVVDAFYKELRKLTNRPAKVSEQKDSRHHVLLKALP